MTELSEINAINGETLAKELQILQQSNRAQSEELGQKQKVIYANFN